MGAVADGHNEPDGHDEGLQHDLMAVLTRRRAMGLLMSLGATPLIAACDGPAMSQPEQDRSSTGPNGVLCVKHPEETAGPFPADGSNRAHGTLANVLEQSGIVREDMRSSLGNAASTAEGIVLDLEITLQDVSSGCAPLAGYAVYLWHCDAAGQYSIYNVKDESYLRAVGVADDQGRLKFRTIFPGCYRGRYPHMHFEVYPNLHAATDYRNRLLTSQLAMPAEECRQVYASAASYRESVAAFEDVSLERDGIFRDNTAAQLTAQTPVIDGDVRSGLIGRVTIGLAARA